MSGARTIVSSAVMIAVLGLGFGMWLVVPTEERRRDVIKNLPESNQMRTEEARRRRALVMQALKDAAETDDNIVTGFGRTVK